MSTEIFLVVPEPPSLNEKYINRQFIVSEAWRNYRPMVQKMCMAERMKPFIGEVAVKINWYYAGRIKDIDSKLKCLFDALESRDGNFGAYKNDNQIGELVVNREESKEPRMVLSIKKMSVEKKPQVLKSRIVLQMENKKSKISTAGKFEIIDRLLSGDNPLNLKITKRKAMEILGMRRK
jgi:Holliday junction resolvase RusA-like endonuclease